MGIGMTDFNLIRDRVTFFLTLLCGVIALTACETLPEDADTAPPAEVANYDYIIGPGDQLRIFVWRNPDLSTDVPVRPDGKISIPLVEDLEANGQTPTALARAIEKQLGDFIKDPLVTVTVVGFQGMFSKQIRVVGEAAQPRSLPYSDDMSVLDVMIAVGGLTEFADGNKTRIVRSHGGDRQMTVRLEDLLKDGDISANIKMAPGDVIIIPEAWF